MTSQQTHTLRHASIIVGLSTCFYLYEFFLRVMPSVITQELMIDFNINQTLLGQFLATFFYAYAFAQIPAGLLCDQYGPKKCLIYAVLICGLATYVLQHTNNLLIASSARLAIGAVSASAFIGPLSLSARWFPSHLQALVAGCVQVMGCLGAIFAGQPLARIVQTWGWRPCLYYTAWIGIVLAVLFYWIIQDSPEETVMQKESKSENINTRDILKQVCSNSQSWAIGILAFGSWAAIAVFAESWGIPYLSKLQNISVDQAAEQAMWVWISMAVISPIAGYWSDYIKNRKKPILLFLSIGLVASCILLYCPPSQSWAISTLLFMIGVSSAAQPITFGLVNDHHNTQTMATALSFNNMALVSSAMFLQPIVGILLDLFQGVQIEPSLLDYQLAFTCIPISIGASILVCLFWAKETHCKKQPQTLSEQDDLKEFETQATSSI